MVCTRAKKRHLARTLAALVAYVVTFLATYLYALHHHRPQGVTLFVCAMLPWAIMCGVILSIGMYFHEERDGYSRDLAMRIMLWGAGAAMAANLFLMFLHIFGWKGQPPAYLELCVFVGASLAARIAYGIANRPEC